MHMPVDKRLGLQVVGDQFLGNDYRAVHWIGFLCGWEGIRTVQMVIMLRIVLVCIQMVAPETRQMFMST